MPQKKSSRKKQQKKAKSQNSKELPFVSICTPTYNRRPFFPLAINCFNHQTYPKEKMEWNIIDDGIDKVGDLVSHIPQVNYKELPEKIALGKKRNMLHEMCKGKIIIYMDDDDYYPPERVQHAVEMLLKNPTYKIAGSSIMHIYFNHDQSIFRFGPYGKYHSTAATFAFRKDLLNDTSFQNEACLAEEKLFLKGYTIPLLQLDSLKSILVFSHPHNTFDKRELLRNYENNKFITKTNLKIVNILKTQEKVDMYTTKLLETLKTYELGTMKYKSDVMAQKKRIDKERHDRMMFEKKKQFRLYTLDKNGNKRVLEYFELVEQLQSLQKENMRLKSTIKELSSEESKSLENTVVEKEISPQFDTISENEENKEQDNLKNINIDKASGEQVDLATNLLGR